MTGNLGAKPCFLSSLHISRSVDHEGEVLDMLLQRRRDTRAAARHRYIRSPAIRTTISSRCQRLLSRGRYRLSRRAMTGPNFSTQPVIIQHGLALSALHAELSRRWKAMAAIGDFGHRASLRATSVPSYPVTLQSL